jgi:signal transduction histidine kinase
MPFPALTDRLQALDPRRMDLVLALAAGVEMQVEALLLHGGVPAGSRVVAHVCMLALAVAIYMRRRLPLLALVIAQVVFVVVQAEGKAVADNLYLGLFVVLFLTFSAAIFCGERTIWVAAAVALTGGLVSQAVDEYDSTLADALLASGLIFVLAPMVAGRLVRSRSRLQAALRTKAERAERDRATAAARAVADERTRIAGELHDIVAHALGEMTVQATAARRLAERDPDRARAAFGNVEASGREALGELRRLLGVLRRDDEDFALAPTPSLRHLAALAGRTRAAGLPVELTVEGRAPELPPGLDVTGYRVVQEALGRALGGRHAGRAEVRVRYGDRAAELEIVDDGDATTPDADALLGLRERVGIYGGDLHAQELAGGGHVVRARLPVEAAA